jgi:hypothetical protein
LLLAGEVHFDSDDRGLTQADAVMEPRPETDLADLEPSHEPDGKTA